ncbi:hypothetical protein L0Y40_00365 [Candidatus Wolfebacteria bacterium]|nr:hypothetical protein [Candidatus Wolfebacteria bacterium]
MKKLSTGEWVAVVAALILGVAIFMVDALFRAPVPVVPDDIVTGDIMPVPGESGTIETPVSDVESL